MSHTPLQEMALALKAANINYTIDDDEDLLDAELLDDGINLDSKNGLSYSIQIQNDFSPAGGMKFSLISSDGYCFKYLIDTNNASELVEKYKSL